MGMHAGTGTVDGDRTAKGEEEEATRPSRYPEDGRHTAVRWSAPSLYANEPRYCLPLSAQHVALAGSLARAQE